jgi:hypothetical protein
VFFGLSGTGKTTLSGPPRMLIGDDEHGWSDRGIFNFEGGCYAKTINLDPRPSPRSTPPPPLRHGRREHGLRPRDAGARFRRRQPDANTRVRLSAGRDLERLARPLGGHPKNVIMLTCDAFGVLPPIARLTPAQAMYHFLSGFTSKVAGTERGVTEPEPTFSTCFGAPFMPRRPEVYGKLLQDKIAEHGADLLAGQHRLDRRRLRHRLAHADQGHPRAADGGAERLAQRKAEFRRTRISASRCRSRCPAWPTCCWTRAAPGPMRPPMTRRRQAGGDVRRQFRAICPAYRR